MRLMSLTILRVEPRASLSDTQPGTRVEGVAWSGTGYPGVPRVYKVVYTRVVQ